MRFVKTAMIVATMMASSVASAQNAVVFDFNSQEAVDALNGQVGADFTVDGVTMSTNATGPEFTVDLETNMAMATGATVDLQTIVTDLLEANPRLAINNQTITDDQFQALTGTEDEDAFISTDETLTISFDDEVVITSIDFFGIGGDEIVTATISGIGPGTFDFPSVPGGDVYADPFGAGVMIPAGTDIVFTLAGDGDNDRYGFSVIEVDTASAPPCLLGDVNMSGNVDFADIAPFIAILSSNGFECEADVNVSGTVDFADIAPFIAILASS